MMKKLALLVATLAASAAVAQSEQPTAPPVSTDPGYQANRLICRTISESGSRLRRQRRCATRAQWDEQQRIDRSHIERAQLNKIRP